MVLTEAFEPQKPFRSRSVDTGSSGMTVFDAVRTVFA